jgi:preprotein translocase subunit SecG
MSSFLLQNLSTIITILILLVLVTIALVIIYHNKKKGKSISCGGDCSHCAGACSASHINRSRKQSGPGIHQSKN